MADSLIDSVDHTVEERDALIAKWKDKPADEVLNAKVESDLYIKTLTARMDEVKNDYLKLREEHQASAELKDLIKTLQDKSKEQDTTQDTQRDTIQPSLKPEDIETIVSNEIAKNDQVKKQRDNFNLVKAKLKEQFGDNANTVFIQRRDTLGLTQEFADELAKTHPAVFMKTFGLDEPVRQEGYTPPPRSAVRPDRFAPTTQKRDWNYYQELLKKDPRGYLDPKIAVQMHNDAVELGEAFGMPKD